MSAVIAKSFARIFFRNAVNIGLLVLEMPEAADEIAENDILTLDDDKITDETTGKTYPLPPMYVKDILEKGGLMEAIK